MAIWEAKEAEDQWKQRLYNERQNNFTHALGISHNLQKHLYSVPGLLSENSRANPLPMLSRERQKNGFIFHQLLLKAITVSLSPHG